MHNPFLSVRFVEDFVMGDRRSSDKKYLGGSVIAGVNTKVISNHGQELSSVSENSKE